MVLFGNLSNVVALFDRSEAMRNLYKYLLEALDSSTDTHGRIISLDCSEGRVERKFELGFGMIAIEQSYKLEGGIFESHRKYIDFQLMVKGSEYMDCGNIRDFSISSAYNENKDVALYYHSDDVSRILLNEGGVAIFFPYDVHRGGIKASDDVVYKSVVKVPHTLLEFCF